MSAVFGNKCSVKVPSSIFVLFLGLFILFFDQLTKYLTSHFIARQEQAVYLYPYNGIGIFKNFLGIEFSLNYMTNKGAAWGILGDYQQFLVLVRIILIIGLLIYLLFFNSRSLWKIPLTLILAGALGNVIDFFVYGHVVDMFHFVLWGYDFPVFNIADSAITVGIGSLFFLSWLEP